MILSKPAFELHQKLRDHIENDCAYYGSVCYRDLLNHFFGINVKDESKMLAHRTLLEVGRNSPKYRKQTYPEVVQIDFRLLYVRLAKRFLGTRLINGVCMDDWYTALFREWKDLKNLHHSESKELHSARQAIKHLLHFTYPMLAIHGLISEDDVKSMVAIVGEVFRELIEVNKDSHYPIVISPDGIVFGTKFTWSREKRRHEFVEDEFKLTKACEYFNHDLLRFQSVYPISGRQYILMKDDSDAVGISQIKNCDDDLYNHWIKNLEFWIDLGDTSLFETL